MPNILINITTDSIKERQIAWKVKEEKKECKKNIYAV